MVSFGVQRRMRLLCMCLLFAGISDWFCFSTYFTVGHVLVIHTVRKVLNHHNISCFFFHLFWLHDSSVGSAVHMSLKSMRVPLHAQSVSRIGFVFHRGNKGQHISSDA